MNVNQKFNAQMQTLSPEFQERFYEAQKEEWDKIPFVFDTPETMEVFMPKLAKYREFALMFETPASLNISPSYFVHIMHGNIENYFVSDIVTMCQAFERRTYYNCATISGGFTPSMPQSYADFLSLTDTLTNQINAIVEPIKDTLIRKMQSLQALQLKSGNRKIELA